MMMKQLNEQRGLMEGEAFNLSGAIFNHVQASLTKQRAKERMERIEDAALINPEITGPYTNEKQRMAAVRLHLEADDKFLSARASYEDAVKACAVAEGAIEEYRAKLSSRKRLCEMLVAVARGSGE